MPNQSGKKNTSIFGFIKDLIAPNNESKEIKHIDKEISTENISDEENTKDLRQDNRQRNNRNRRNNRNMKSNYKDKSSKDVVPNNLTTKSDNKISEKSSKEISPKDSKISEKPVLADKPAAAKPKKKAEKLPKVDLNSVGLELVETSSKPVAEPQKEKPKKASPKKTADWQKQKSDKKETKALVMVETKQTKVAKPKTTSKPRKSKATLKKG